MYAVFGQAPQGPRTQLQRFGLHAWCVGQVGHGYVLENYGTGQLPHVRAELWAFRGLVPAALLCGWLDLARAEDVLALVNSCRRHEHGFLCVGPVGPQRCSRGHLGDHGRPVGRGASRRDCRGVRPPTPLLAAVRGGPGGAACPESRRVSRGVAPFGLSRHDVSGGSAFFARGAARALGSGTCCAFNPAPTARLRSEVVREYAGPAPVDSPGI